MLTSSRNTTRIKSFKLLKASVFDDSNSKQKMYAILSLGVICLFFVIKSLLFLTDKVMSANDLLARNAIEP